MPSRKETAAGIVGVSVLAKSPAARRALMGLLRQGGRTLGPWGLAAYLAYEGYIRRNQLRNVANEIAERMPSPVSGQGGDPSFRSVTWDPNDPFGPNQGFVQAGLDFREQLFESRDPGGRRRRRRKKGLSKFNKAVSSAVKAVKKHTPKASGKAVFSKATKIASKANPVTKTRIGKGKSFAQKTARKIRKSVWGVTKRFRK